MSDELKPCPFCGKEEAQAVQNPSTTYWGVICFWCEASNFGACYFSKQEAETAWNTRHTPDITELQAENAQLRERLAAVEGWHDASEPPPYVKTVAGKPKAMEIDYSEPVEVAFMCPTVPYRRKRVRVGSVVHREVWETDSGVFDGKYEIKDNHPIAGSMRVIAWREQPAAPQGGDHER